MTHSAAASNDEYDARNSGMFGHDDHGSATTWLVCAAESPAASSARAMNPVASQPAAGVSLRRSSTAVLHVSSTSTIAVCAAPMASRLLKIAAPATAHTATATTSPRLQRSSGLPANAE